MRNYYIRRRRRNLAQSDGNDVLPEAVTGGGFHTQQSMAIIAVEREEDEKTRRQFGMQMSVDEGLHKWRNSP